MATFIQLPLFKHGTTELKPVVFVDIIFSFINSILYKYKFYLQYKIVDNFNVYIEIVVFMGMFMGGCAHSCRRRAVSMTIYFLLILFCFLLFKKVDRYVNYDNVKKSKISDTVFLYEKYLTL